MTILVGIDGCKFGWLRITKDLENGTLNSMIFKSTDELFVQTPSPAVFAIDIPIGLTDSGSRKCDVQARRLLGARRGTSVFPSPIRPVMNVATRKEADKIHRSIDGRGVNVFPGICTRESVKSILNFRKIRNCEIRFTRSIQKSLSGH